MEKARGEFYKGGGRVDVDSVQERLAEAALRGAIWESQRVADTEAYEGVEEYDPVLRSHCRLE